MSLLITAKWALPQIEGIVAFLALENVVELAAVVFVVAEGGEDGRLAQQCERISRPAVISGYRGCAHLRGRRFHVEYRRRSVGEAALAEAEFVHEAAYVVLIVTDAEAAFDGLGEFARGPAIGGEAVGLRALEIHDANNFDLIRGETAGAAGGATFAHTVDTFHHDGSVPAGGSCAAHAKAARYLRLRETVQQLTGGCETASFHIVACKRVLRGKHSSRYARNLYRGNPRIH